MLLVGRSAEQERIEQLLRDARGGRSRVLVVRGEAGIGKTSLLRYALDLAEAMTVARASGVESEAELQFSGLLEVCRPLLVWLDALAPHQRSALQVALGFEEGRQSDRFAVGAATLALFATAAEERPLLVVVDDAHWLDDGSAAALRFAARRLLADRVAVVFAARSGDPRGFEGEGFEELELSGLRADDARRLLERTASVSIPDEVAARITDATGGNPLALVELPGLLEVDRLSGVEQLPGRPLPAGAGVERAFSRRLERLDDDCRRALVVLAAASSRELAPAVRALAELGLAPEALEPAEAEGLLELDGERFAFQHPLLRGVVYQAATASERRSAHRALADASAGAAGLESRAWHLAAAAVGPDGDASDALALVAAQARDRSGFGSASAAYERAARLSVDDGLRLERLLAAAESAWEGGAADRSVALVDETLGSGAEAGVRSRLLLLRGRIALQSGALPDARALLGEAAASVERNDPPAAAAALTYVVFCCHFEGRIAEALDVARRARALVPADGGAADLRLDYVLGRSLLLAGDTGAGTPLVERMVEAARVADVARAQLAAAAIVHSVLERPDESRELVGRVLELARAEGPMALVYALSVAAETELRAGRLDRAAGSAAEGLELARELGQSNIVAVLLVVLARVEALRGAEDAFRGRAAEARPLLEAAGMALPLEQLACSEALLALGLGRLEQAVETLRASTARVEQMGVFDRDAMPEPELVETLVRLGRDDEARAVLESWRRRGVPESVSLGAASAFRCEGLLAPDDAFAPLFAGAIERHVAHGDPLGEARARLCLGERLRRAGHRVDSRQELRSALEGFERLDAGPWAERARQELRASGGRLRRREEARDELTPQELQVALQVAEGKSNKEVAAAMFLSPKTVEFHLGRIFRKLDVGSRTELARRIAAEGALPAAVG